MNWVPTVEGGGAFSRRLVGPGLHTRWETGYELVMNWVSTVEGGRAFSRRLVGPGLHTRWETGYELVMNWVSTVEGGSPSLEILTNCPVI